jgi:hypothetical protein
MITEIKTISDVKHFAHQLIGEGLNFHPDDNFRDYVFNTTQEPYYSVNDATVRNTLMDQCFEVCNRESVDIYDTMLEEFLKGTGLDKYVPLPSSGQTITDLN